MAMALDDDGEVDEEFARLAAELDLSMSSDEDGPRIYPAESDEKEDTEQQPAAQCSSANAQPADGVDAAFAGAKATPVREVEAWDRASSWCCSLRTGCETACRDLIQFVQEEGTQHPAVAQFKRQGGMQLLSRLLRGTDAGLLEVASSAIATIGAATARPTSRQIAVADGLTIHLQELPYELAGTGHAVWTSARVLALWLARAATEEEAAYPVLRRVGSALELGSGVGLAGLTLAGLAGRRRLPDLMSVTLTDVVPAIVGNLRSSARRNAEAAAAEMAKQYEGQEKEPATTLRVRACLYDWADELAASSDGDGRQAADHVESSRCAASDVSEPKHSAHYWPGIAYNEQGRVREAEEDGGGEEDSLLRPSAAAAAAAVQEAEAVARVSSSPREDDNGSGSTKASGLKLA